MSLAERYAQLKHQIDVACRRAGRSAREVRIVAVSKTFPPEVVLEAIAAGVTEFGENRAQELEAKLAAMPEPQGRSARWHFVGALQTNKVRVVVGAATLIHSVDRLRLGREIARRARDLGIVQQVLIEINLAAEPTKHGVDPAGALPLATEIASLEGLAVKGLMTIPPIADDPESSRAYFEELARLSSLLVRELPDARELSMGMSRDFEVAIEEGATIVRVGEALFGPRSRT